MKGKRNLVMSLVAAALVLFAAARAGMRLWEDQQLADAFRYTENAAWQQYRDGVPMEEIEFAAYAPLFEVNSAMIGRETRLVLSEALTFYEDAEGKKRPVLTLDAGSVVNAGLWEPGYGFFTYPTYEAGWRWVQPFVPDGEEPEADAPRYYVRLEELAAAARPRVTEDAARAGLSAEEYARLQVCRADIFFYDSGVFLSPDLLSPVWSWDCTAAVLLAALDAAALLILSLRAHRRAQAANTSEA